MKLVLTKTELAEVIRRSYRAMDGHSITDVTIQPYSADFCTIELEEAAPPEPRLVSGDPIGKAMGPRITANMPEAS